jgi:hypothetical protein
MDCIPDLLENFIFYPTCISLQGLPDMVKNICQLIVILMMLTFLMDQIQELGCALFKAAHQRCRSRLWLWERLRAFFHSYLIDTWEILWEAIAKGHRAAKLAIDDSS